MEKKKKFSWIIVEKGWWQINFRGEKESKSKFMSSSVTRYEIICWKKRIDEKQRRSGEDSPQ